jgi:predicted SprT family Zn-dependent metalloprotease
MEQLRMDRTIQTIADQGSAANLNVSLGVTTLQHSTFDIAFNFFNIWLFAGLLPDCLITLQRKASSYGYFHRKRFDTRDGGDIRDEIALNPATFANRSDVEILSTLVHEMVHCKQANFGHPSRNGYHNREWAAMMTAIGLTPTHNGNPGGRRTGQRMTHLIDDEGPFMTACNQLLASGFHVTFVETSLDRENAERVRRMKNESHTRFVCPNCGAQVRGKPATQVDCRPCDEPMVVG